MERGQEKKIGGQGIFYILPLFLGSTTIQWVTKLFLNTNEMVASPSQSVKICLSFLGIHIQIWYLRRLTLLRKYVHYSAFSVVVVKSIIWCLSCNFDECIRCF